MQTPTSLPRQAVLNLDVTLDDADLWGAIEWTLATARRTGLSLDRLDLAADTAAPGRLLKLRVGAPDNSLLNLFVKRLQNGIDVRDVRCADRSAAPRPLPAATQDRVVASPIVAGHAALAVQ